MVLQVLPTGENNVSHHGEWKSRRVNDKSRFCDDKFNVPLVFALFYEQNVCH